MTEDNGMTPFKDSWKNKEPRFLHLEKISFENELKIKTFSAK